MLENPQFVETKKIAIIEGEAKTRNLSDIRGHHLPMFQSLLSGEFEPREIAQRIPLDKSKGFDFQFLPGKLHSEDVIGYSRRSDRYDASVEKYRASVEDLLSAFFALPDNSPINLVSGRPDSICGLCAVGDHCKMSKSENSGYDLVKGDFAYINTFLIAAEAQGIKSETVEEEQSFIDIPETKMVKVVKTTKGTLKNVLPNIDFQFVVPA